ncbi:MAG: glycyl radical protein [Bacteroidales bacterium]|nr:glycyl radical protein [Bacteroidales bacterium]MCF8404401.1 glycyl radical protein [Bacteroidales bacterium]
MNPRIAQLRKQSTQILPSISSERAELITKFYQTPEALKASIPMQRALAFKYILDNKKICINPGELIVGERGPSPQATPTYPEICLHSVDDLDILNNRVKIPFLSDDQTRESYQSKIIPYWAGKTIRDKMFKALPIEWQEAYQAGVFTEFMEQRPPGHTVLDNKIYSKGMLDFIGEIQLELNYLKNIPDRESKDKIEELKAMQITAEAIIMFARRHADKLSVMAQQENETERKTELEQMSSMCLKVPAHAPQNFWEALQYYWFIHVGVVTEVNPWDSFNPGRLDQHLFPFYEREMENGSLTSERAKEILQSFWIKFNNHPAPPKIGITAKESNTYTDFTLINVGGLKEDGSDGVNELTYLILDVIEEMRLLQPGSMVQLSKKNPDRYVLRFLDIIKTGYGQPSVFNTDAIIQEMLRVGKSIEDARNGGASGCVETGAFGKEAYILTGYFNIPKVLEITLNNGVDPRTDKLVGIKTGDPASFNSFGEVMEAFNKQLQHFLAIKINGNNIIDRIYAQYLPVPFLSLLIDDCIKTGKDYHNGGARYNTSYIQGVGMGSITDALSAIKFHVFEKSNISMQGMMDALKNNFNDYEEFHKVLLDETPKYGNDNEFADEILRQVFNMYFSAIDGKPTARGGAHRVDLLPTTCHVYFGSVIGALPDGRKAGVPLSEGISPVQGADRNGPTAVIKSAAKIDHIKTGGTLLNQKFTPGFFDSSEGIQALKHLIRSYFKLDGHHIQFNVVKAETLRKAKKNPEKYRDLIVRVAGYSDYFVDLTEELQDEIIRRTEHMEG